jgi:peroxiredoxin
MKDKNVVVLTVNVGENDDAVYSFVNSTKPALSFPVLFDTDSKAMDTWGAIGLPSTYIVNKKGNIVYKAVGGRDFESPDILDKILKLSEEPIK